MHNTKKRVELSESEKREQRDQAQNRRILLRQSRREERKREGEINSATFSDQEDMDPELMYELMYPDRSPLPLDRLLK